MKPLGWAYQLTTLVVATVVCTIVLKRHDVAVAQLAIAKQELKVAQQQTSKFKALYAEAVTSVAHDAARVTRSAARTDALRERVLPHITDTVTVKEYIVAADSTIHACRELVTDCDRMRHAADSTILSVQIERESYRHLYEGSKRRFRDRFGLCAGYGVSASPGGQLSHGVQVGVCARLFP